MKKTDSNFRYYRERLGMRQEDVANYLGLAKTTYAAYEQGTAQADYETLKRLSRLYDVTINQLLEKDARTGYLLDDDQCKKLAESIESLDELAKSIGIINKETKTPKRQTGKDQQNEK